MSAENFARINARLAELRALTPDPREGIYPASEAAAATARNVARAMLAMGRKPHTYATPDTAPPDAQCGGCTVECDEVDVYVSADGRIASVVTLMEGDDD